MFERSRRTRLVLVACTVTSIALITLDARDPSGGPLDALGSAVRVVLGPIQRGVAAVVRPIGDAFSGFARGGSMRARIEALELENAELRAMLEQTEDLIRENEELRAEADLPQRLNLATLAASVIASGPSNFERVIIVNKGSADGLEVDMPVLGNGGLAGRIIRVSPTTADVLLLIDRSSAVAARLAANGELGTVSGRAGSTMELELLDPRARVAEGDQVVTSGYSGGLFPPGIPIGVVIAAPEAGAELTRRAVVRPTVDFSRVSFVRVVTGRVPRAQRTATPAGPRTTP
jgi:rod shape-determining protein MreC